MFSTDADLLAGPTVSADLLEPNIEPVLFDPNRELALPALLPAADDATPNALVTPPGVIGVLPLPNKLCEIVMEELAADLPKGLVVLPDADVVNKLCEIGKTDGLPNAPWFTIAVELPALVPTELVDFSLNKLLSGEGVWKSCFVGDESPDPTPSLAVVSGVVATA